MKSDGQTSPSQYFNVRAIASEHSEAILTWLN
jgi:hypothetical protein